MNKQGFLFTYILLTGVLSFILAAEGLGLIKLAGNIHYWLSGVDGGVTLMGIAWLITNRTHQRQTHK